MKEPEVSVQHMAWTGVPRADGLTEHWRVVIGDDEGETACLLTRQQLLEHQANVNRMVVETASTAPDKNVRSWGWVSHYFSTACLHKQHDACREACKFCEKRCRCSCHRAGAVLGPEGGA